MRIASRRFTPLAAQTLSRGSWSINQLDSKVNVDPSVCVIGDIVKINTLGDPDWSDWGGPAVAVVGDEFELTDITTRVGNGEGTVDDLNFEVDVGVVPGEMNNYNVWIVLMRYRYYTLTLTTGIEWPSWWIPTWYVTTMDIPTVTALFVPSGSGLVLADIGLSGPNITDVLEDFPSNTIRYGGDFPAGANSMPNYLFTEGLLQQLGMSNIKSFFALDAYEYEGKLANYMRGQILYSFVPVAERSIGRDMSLNYTNFSGDSPFQTSQASFYNYDTQNSDNNTLLVLLVIFFAVLSIVFGFLAFYPRGSRLSRFA